MTTGVFPYDVGNVGGDIFSENKDFALRAIDIYKKYQNSKKGIYTIITPHNIFLFRL
jgi:hypothetical protein